MSEHLPPIVIPIEAIIRDLLTDLAAADAAIRAFAKKEERVLADAGDGGGREFGDGFVRGMRRSLASGGGGNPLVGFLAGLGRAGAGLAMPTLFTGLIYGAAQAVAALAPLVGLVNLLPAGIAALAASLITLKMAFKGVGTAVSAGLSGDMEKYGEALAKLAPAARAAVKEIVALKPAMDALRMGVQQAFWSQLTGSIKALGTQYLPMLRNEMSGLAAALGGQFRGVIDLLTHSEFVFDDIRTTLRNITEAARIAQPALANIVDAFANLAAVGSGFLPRLSQAVTDLTGRFQQFIARASESGDLERWIDAGIDALKMFGGLLVDVWHILNPIIKALNATNSGGFGFLGTLLHDLGEFLNSAKGAQFLTTLFNSLNTIFGLLSHTLQALLPIVGQVLLGLKPLIDALGRPDVVAVIDDLAVSLTQMVAALVPAIPPLTELIVALLPLLPPLIQLAAESMQVWWPLIAQGIEMLNTGLIPALMWLTGVLESVVAWVHNFLAPARDMEGTADKIAKAFWRFVHTLQELPGKAGAALRALPGVLANMARQAMQRLAYHIGYGIGQTLKHLIEFPGQVWALLRSMADGAQEILVGLIVRWVKIFTEAPGKAKTALNELPGKIKEVFINVGVWLYQAGVDLVQGLLDGVKSMWTKSYNFVKDLGKNLIQGFRDAVGWHSPATMFVAGGAAIVAGLVQGIEDNAADALRAVRGLLTFGGGGIGAPAFALGMAGAGGVLGPGGAHAGMAGPIVVHNKVYLDGKELHAGLIRPAQRYKDRTGTTGLS